MCYRWWINRKEGIAFLRNHFDVTCSLEKSELMSVGGMERGGGRRNCIAASFMRHVIIYNTCELFFSHYEAHRNCSRITPKCSNECIIRTEKQFRNETVQRISLNNKGYEIFLVIINQRAKIKYALYYVTNYYL